MAQRISSFFVAKKIIKEEEKKIYDYCMEVLLASVINFLAMFGIAVFIQMTLLALCFMVGFAVIRITAGGFHANTHIKCFGIMISIYVVVLIILRKIPEKEILFFTTICSICSSIVILILSPVENKNRLIDREDSLKFKRQSVIRTISLLALAYFVSFSFKCYREGFSMVIGISVASLSLIAGTIKNKYEGKEGRIWIW